MPRKKQTVTEDVKGAQQVVDITPPAPKTADELVEEHFKLEDWLKAENARFAEHVKPVVERQEAIKMQLLEKLNAEGLENFKTDHGTAYKSRILNTKIDAEAAPYVRDGEELRGREALLDFCLDNWDEIGNELLMISAQKDAVKNYMEQNEGRPPPGITTSIFTRLNIRRS